VSLNASLGFLSNLGSVADPPQTIQFLKLIAQRTFFFQNPPPANLYNFSEFFDWLFCMILATVERYRNSYHPGSSFVCKKPYTTRDRTHDTSLFSCKKRIFFGWKNTLKSILSTDFFEFSASKNIFMTYLRFFINWEGSNGFWFPDSQSTGQICKYLLPYWVISCVFSCISPYTTRTGYTIVYHTRLTTLVPPHIPPHHRKRRWPH